MRTSPDGTIDVRVTLTVQVDPIAWARTMMDTDPDELTQKEVRRDVKRFIRGTVAELGGAESAHDPQTSIPLGDVTAEGLYDVSPVGRA